VLLKLILFHNVLIGVILAMTRSINEYDHLPITFNYPYSPMISAIVGSYDGWKVGSKDGSRVGQTLDLLLGRTVGVLGVLVGETEGPVGRLEGSLLGFTDGSDDGSVGKSVLGAVVRFCVGLLVGR